MGHNVDAQGGSLLVLVGLAVIPPLVAQAVEVYGASTCALSQGEVWCWGNNNGSVLGTGNQLGTLPPTRVQVGCATPPCPVLNNVVRLPHGATSGVTGLGVGTNIFRWTINNGACANPISTDDVAIVVNSNAQGAANAGPDQQACSTAPNATLTANAANPPAVGTWSLVSGTGTIASPGSSTTAVSAMGIGANVFRWSLTNGACGNTNDQVTVLVYDANMSESQKRRWHSWEDYIREWCRRADFSMMLPQLLEGEDPDFSAYITSVAERQK